MEKFLKAAEVLTNSYDEFYNLDKTNPSFTLLEGSIKNVMFSCPHAVKQIRNKKEKLADIHTGPLGKALHSLGYTVLIKTNTLNDDANYDIKSKYKAFLSKYIRKNKILFLVDLHGMAAKRKISICLGTGFGIHYNKKSDLTSLFVECATENKLDCTTIGIDFPFFASSRTVSGTINRRNRIETLQVEINSSIFSNKEKTIALLKTLDECVKRFLALAYFKTSLLNKKQFYTLDNTFNFAEFSTTPFKQNNLNSNILITAPHSCSMIKEGFECYKETFSGVLASMLSSDLSFSTLIKTNKTDYDSTNQYIDEVSSFVKQNNISCVLELHIMNSKRKQDAVICCNEGSSLGKSQSLVYNVVNILLKNKFSNFLIDYPFNAKNYSSSVNMIHENTGIPAFKLIFNTRLFKNSKNINKVYKILQEIAFNLNQ